MGGGKSRYVDIRFHYVKDGVANGEVKPVFVTTLEMPADILTKGLGEELHRSHVLGMGIAEAQSGQL